jgi:hypothetical protein
MSKIRNTDFLLNVVLIIIVLTYFSYGIELKANFEYFLDNMALKRPSYLIGISDIMVPGGSFSFGTSLSNWRMDLSKNGLKKFSTDVGELELLYSSQTLNYSYGLNIKGGIADIFNRHNFYIGTQIPFSIKLQRFSQIRFLNNLEMRYGYADDNPFMAKIGAKKLSFNVNSGVGIGYWEIHAGYGYSLYDKITRDMYGELLEDTVFFSVLYDTLNPVLNLIDVNTSPFPKNKENRFTIYFFGPVLNFLYIGTSFSYRNMKENYYLPIADSDNAKIFYTFFPYYTPQNEGSFNLIFSPVYFSENLNSFCNKAQIKISFPLYSFGTYRGFYMAVNGNILAGFKDFYYDYYGTGAFSIEAEYEKLFKNQLGISVKYLWVSKPYLAYNFFEKNNYQYQLLNVSVKKAF